MRPLGRVYAEQKLCQDFATLKSACPKGLYVTPLPDDPLTWAGVLFVRKGPYANAVLRFHVDFPETYPARPPTVAIANDVFHPLVTPLTTYTYGVRDTGTDTVSAADRDRLPPGGLSLRHGFPEWFSSPMDGSGDKDTSATQGGQLGPGAASDSIAEHSVRRTPHTVEVLQYLALVFSTEALLDSVPLEAAANTGAWHAWRSFRMKMIGGTQSSVVRSSSRASDAPSDRSMSPRQQPGGARRPGEWNWQGVWEDRVRKSVQASISETALYGGNGSEVICFSKTEAGVPRV